MPYVPSKKTPKHMEKYGEDDREFLQPYILDAARSIADKTTDVDVQSGFKKAFRGVAEKIKEREEGGNSSPLNSFDALGNAIFNVAIKYNYRGAWHGELNYAITRLIQEVPKAMVKDGKWKSELRYWLYVQTGSPLTKMVQEYHAKGDDWLNGGLAFIFEDIKDEFKARVNRPYEGVQILKSADCYDGQYINRLMMITDKEGNDIGSFLVDVAATDENKVVDVLRAKLIAE